MLFWLAAAAGLGAVVSSAIARRTPGAWAGIVAAAPVTPTAAVLVLNEYGEAPWLVLLEGTASVVAVLAVLSFMALLTHRTRGIPVWVAILVLVPPLSWTVRLAVPLVLQLALLPLAAIGTSLVLGRRELGGSRLAGARLSVIQRFALGALAVALVATVAELFPVAAGLVALFPVLFTAALAVATLDGGVDRAWVVAKGGVAGSVGVVAFALAGTFAASRAGWPGAGPALLLAWAVFFAASGAWAWGGRFGSTVIGSGRRVTQHRRDKTKRTRGPIHLVAMRQTGVAVPAGHVRQRT